MGHCSNCKKQITVNFDLHELHCAKHLQLCLKCDEPYPKDDIEDHWRNDHQMIFCSAGCGQSFEKLSEDEHLHNTCAFRQSQCKYCELQDTVHNLENHQASCGSRTEKCPYCDKFILVKYFEQHQSLHLEWIEKMKVEGDSLGSQPKPDGKHVSGYPDRTKAKVVTEVAPKIPVALGSSKAAEQNRDAPTTVVGPNKFTGTPALAREALEERPQEKMRSGPAFCQSGKNGPREWGRSDTARLTHTPDKSSPNIKASHNGKVAATSTSIVPLNTASNKHAAAVIASSPTRNSVVHPAYDMPLASNKETRCQPLVKTADERQLTAVELEQSYSNYQKNRMTVSTPSKHETNPAVADKTQKGLLTSSATVTGSGFSPTVKQPVELDKPGVSSKKQLYQELPENQANSALPTTVSSEAQPSRVQKQTRSVGNKSNSATKTESQAESVEHPGSKTDYMECPQCGVDVFRTSLENHIELHNQFEIFSNGSSQDRISQRNFQKSALPNAITVTKEHMKNKVSRDNGKLLASSLTSPGPNRSEENGCVPSEISREGTPSTNGIGRSLEFGAGFRGIPVSSVQKVHQESLSSRRSLPTSSFEPGPSQIHPGSDSFTGQTSAAEPVRTHLLARVTQHTNDPVSADSRDMLSMLGIEIPLTMTQVDADAVLAKEIEKQEKLEAKLKRGHYSGGWTGFGNQKSEVGRETGPFRGTTTFEAPLRREPPVGRGDAIDRRSNRSSLGDNVSAGDSSKGVPEKEIKMDEDDEEEFGPEYVWGYSGVVDSDDDNPEDEDALEAAEPPTPLPTTHSSAVAVGPKSHGFKSRSVDLNDYADESSNPSLGLDLAASSPSSSSNMSGLRSTNGHAGRISNSGPSQEKQTAETAHASFSRSGQPKPLDVSGLSSTNPHACKNSNTPPKPKKEKTVFGTPPSSDDEGSSVLSSGWRKENQQDALLSSVDSQSLSISGGVRSRTGLDIGEPPIDRSASSWKEAEQTGLSTLLSASPGVEGNRSQLVKESTGGSGSSSSVQNLERPYVFGFQRSGSQRKSDPAKRWTESRDRATPYESEKSVGFSGFQKSQSQRGTNSPGFFTRHSKGHKPTLLSDDAYLGSSQQKGDVAGSSGFRHSQSENGKMTSTRSVFTHSKSKSGGSEIAIHSKPDSATQICNGRELSQGRWTEGGTGGMATSEVGNGRAGMEAKRKGTSESTAEELPCGKCQKLVPVRNYVTHELKCPGFVAPKVKESVTPRRPRTPPHKFTPHRNKWVEDNKPVVCRYCEELILSNNIFSHEAACRSKARQPLKATDAGASEGTFGSPYPVTDKTETDFEFGPCEHCHEPFPIAHLLTHEAICRISALVPSASRIDRPARDKFEEAKQPRQKGSLLSEDYGPCEYCSGTFPLDRLRTHETHCRTRLAMFPISTGSSQGRRGGPAQANREEDVPEELRSVLNRAASLGMSSSVLGNRTAPQGRTVAPSPFGYDSQRQRSDNQYSRHFGTKPGDPNQALPGGCEPFDNEYDEKPSRPPRRKH